MNNFNRRMARTTRWVNMMLIAAAITVIVGAVLGFVH